jgi:hypothetical protein
MELGGILTPESPANGRSSTRRAAPPAGHASSACTDGCSNSTEIRYVGSGRGGYRRYRSRRIRRMAAECRLAAGAGAGATCRMDVELFVEESKSLSWVMARARLEGGEAASGFTVRKRSAPLRSAEVAKLVLSRSTNLACNSGRSRRTVWSWRKS